MRSNKNFEETHPVPSFYNSLDVPFRQPPSSIIHKGCQILQKFRFSSRIAAHCHHTRYTDTPKPLTMQKACCMDLFIPCSRLLLSQCSSLFKSLQSAAHIHSVCVSCPVSHFPWDSKASLRSSAAPIQFPAYYAEQICPFARYPDTCKHCRQCITGKYISIQITPKAHTSIH